MSKPVVNFCPRCGSPTEKKVPEGDNLTRDVCLSCRTIHYQNPKVIVGCIPVWEDKILMCRRAIEPRKGLWTFPCGFMENDESVEEGALRETREEANAEAEILHLHSVYSVPHIGQVYVVFLARLLNLDFHPGPESLETVLQGKNEILWDEIAFSSVLFSLRKYFDDTDRNQGPVYLGNYVKKARLT